MAKKYLTQEEILKLIDEYQNGNLTLSDIGSDCEDSDFDLDADLEGPNNDPEQGEEDQGPQGRVPLLVPEKKQKITHWEDAASFIPEFHPFDTKNSGFTSNLELSDCPTELELFELHFGPEIMSKIVFETNKYIDEHVVRSQSPAADHNLSATSEEEIYVFFGITMLMSQVKKHTMQDYWTTDPLLETPTFGQFMSRNRYKNILRFLHFNDSATFYQCGICSTALCIVPCFEKYHTQ